jgi:glutathione synthase/RimK-type ligase-like ATP-grasp enzyme
LRRHTHGTFVLRGNTGFSANNTFFIRTESDLRNGLTQLLEKGVLPLVSPFEKNAFIEYRVMWLNGLVFAVKKFRNEDGFHNISKGASATFEGNLDKLLDLHAFSKKVADQLGLRCVGIDIFDTPTGFRLLELSIPNVGKFSKINVEHKSLSLNFVERALTHFLNKHSPK